MAALVFHVLVIGALIWERTRYLEGTLGDAGPLGGGQGGGEQLAFVTLAPAQAEQAAAPAPPVPPEPIPVPQAEPLAEPELVEPIPLPPTMTPVEGTAQGTGGGGSQESGTGGGSGGGAGTGTGPGRGGDGGDIQPAVLRGMIITPDCARGQFTILFSVESDGRVSGVDVQPAPKESSCRREFVTRMRQYKFEPAKTPDGRAVASTFSIKVQH